MRPGNAVSSFIPERGNTCHSFCGRRRCSAICLTVIASRYVPTDLIDPAVVGLGTNAGCIVGRREKLAGGGGGPGRERFVEVRERRGVAAGAAAGTGSRDDDMVDAREHVLAAAAALVLSLAMIRLIQWPRMSSASFNRFSRG